MFPPDAVFEPTPIVVRSWKSSVCSPLLLEREAIISNVIEISSMDGQGLKFNAKVKLSLSHNATDTRGHEPVIKMLIGQESNEWVDVNGTMDLRCRQGIEISFCIYMVFYFLDTKIYTCLRSTNSNRGCTNRKLVYSAFSADLKSVLVYLRVVKRRRRRWFSTVSKKIIHA